MQKVVGMLFFLAGATVLLGILTAEIFYPVNYSISKNMVSNLGATRPPDSIIRQPSADIFDISLIVAGLMIFLGTVFLHKFHAGKLIIFSIGFLGLGTFGVGIFPAFHAIAHPLVALVAFLAGGVSAIASSKIIKQPFAFLSILLGVLSLTFLFLGLFFPQRIVPIFGAGGTERWVLYPIMLWLIGFGGYEMGRK